MQLTAEVINSGIEYIIESLKLTKMERTLMEYKNCLEMKRDYMMTIESEECLIAIHYENSEAEKTINLKEKITEQINVYSQEYKPIFENIDTIYVMFNTDLGEILLSFSR